MARKKTHEEFIEEVREKYGDNYEVIGEYVNNSTKILIRHNSENCKFYQWSIRPANLLRGQGCPICGREKQKNSRVKTQECFIKEVRENFGNEYEVLGKYINSKTKIKVRHNCKKCNYYEWDIMPSSLLQGVGCPKCNGGVQKTTEDIKREIYYKYGDEYKLLGEYKKSSLNIIVQHMKCKEIFTTSIYNLLKKGCRFCNKKNRIKSITKSHEQFLQELFDKYKNEYELLEKYKKSNIKIKVRHNCERCNYHEWEITPSKLLLGRGCPICGIEKSKIKQSKTHEQFLQEIKEKYDDEYTILGTYVNNSTKIRVKHNCIECNNHEWDITPNSLLRGRGCPKCFGNIKKTTEEFKKEIYELYGNEYEILGEYKGAKTKTLVRHNCKKCNYHEWNIEPTSLLKGHGCPVCSGNIAKLGVNTIWDTDRWMVDLGVSEEEAKRYSKGSSCKKITVKCPDCGRNKKMRIADIYSNKSISCSCGDGKSYPEKFMFNLLEQLNIDFEIEYSPSWIKPKRYDFYIKGVSCIIETHGEQHYKQTSRKGKRVRTLQEEQINDKYKRETALNNGIKHYIELNCRESNLEYIKNSVLNSELNDLYDLSNINWVSCAEFANKNIVKEVCDYWNNKREDETTGDLMKEFNLGRFAITTYLKKGTKLGWCNYNPKEESLKGGKKSSDFIRKILSKKVEIFKDNKSLGVFKSSSELARQSEILFEVKLSQGCISSVCRGERKSHKGFTFKYVEENK